MAEEDKGMRLYDIAEAYKGLEEMVLVGSEGDINVLELTEYLDGVKTQLNNKVDNIVRFSVNLELSAAAYQTEIDRLEKRKKAFENSAKALRNYIAYSMQRHNIDKLDTGIAKLSFRRSESIEIVDAGKLPASFMVEKITHQPDKKAIKDAIKKGQDVPGAFIRENQSLQIK